VQVDLDLPAGLACRGGGDVRVGETLLVHCSSSELSASLASGRPLSILLAHELPAVTRVDVVDGAYVARLPWGSESFDALAAHAGGR
jgi:hypothetical protein